jgi:ribosomal protein S18 acetylase RimI-like enzyme
MPIDEIRESHTQLHDAWRFFARSSPRGEVLELPEVSIASSNVTWPLLNTAFLPAPVETEEALEKAATAAARYFLPKGRGWMLVLCEDWLSPRLRERTVELLSPHGLTPVMMTTGMVAERLAPVVRPLPALDIRHATSQTERCHISDINARCYDVPLEVGREALDVPALFSGENKGYVGFRQGEAVTSTAVLPLDGVAYVSMVATLPSHRQLGCAEAIVRHGLDEVRRASGIERTVLHATPAGLPVYVRMGYRPVTRFHLYLYMPGH